VHWNSPQWSNLTVLELPDCRGSLRQTRFSSPRCYEPRPCMSCLWSLIWLEWKPSSPGVIALPLSVRNGSSTARLTRSPAVRGRETPQHATFVGLERQSVTTRSQGALIVKASVLLVMNRVRSRPGACHRLIGPIEKIVTDPHSLVPNNQAILDRIDRLEWTLLAASKYSHPSTQCMSSSPVISKASRAAKEAKASIPLSNPYFFTVESVLSWPIFEGQYKSSLNLRDLMTSPSSGNLDYLSPQFSGKSQPLMGVELESCSNLLDNFFSRIHIKNPILDEKEIRQWAREISFNGIGWDSRSCLVVSGICRRIRQFRKQADKRKLLLCALGSVSEDFPSRDPTKPPQSCKDSEGYQLAEAWFGASQKRIGTLLSHGGGILEAQCFFFSAVYLMHTFRPFSAWPLFLQALACCQTFHCFSELSAEVLFPPHQFLEDGPGWRSEESVYWTCFKSELYVVHHSQCLSLCFSDDLVVQGAPLRIVSAWI
jgi:hypothetical protein